MRVYLITILIYFTFISTIVAQPLIQWEGNFGGLEFDESYDIAATSDGGAVAVGHSNSMDFNTSSGFDAYVVKLDADGILEWEAYHGGANEQFANAIVESPDGGYLIVGMGYHAGLFFGSEDFWALKLDANGTLEWEKFYGGAELDEAYDVQPTLDGGYIIAGISLSNDEDVSNNYGSSDCWLVKISSTGVLEWSRNYGGSSSESAQSVQQTRDGGFVVGGYSRSSDVDVSINKGGNDYWVFKVNNIGVLEWEKSFGGSGTDQAFSTIQTLDDGFILAGASDSSDGDVSNPKGAKDYWMVKLDAAGNMEWERSYGGTDSDIGKSVVESFNGGYLLAGYARSQDGDVGTTYGSYDYWLVKLDDFGNISWEQNYGGVDADFGESLVQSGDGGYFITGRSYSDNVDVGGNIGNMDYWVIRLFADVICQTDLYLNSVDNYTSNDLIFHKASNIIEASNVVGNGSKVTYQAGNCLELKAGFEVEQGGEFDGVMGACN